MGCDFYINTYLCGTFITKTGETKDCFIKIGSERGFFGYFEVDSDSEDDWQRQRKKEMQRSRECYEKTKPLFADGKWLINSEKKKKFYLKTIKKDDHTFEQLVTLEKRTSVDPR